MEVGQTYEHLYMSTFHKIFIFTSFSRQHKIYYQHPWENHKKKRTRRWCMYVILDVCVFWHMEDVKHSKEIFNILRILYVIKCIKANTTEFLHKNFLVFFFVYLCEKFGSSDFFCTSPSSFFSSSFIFIAKGGLENPRVYHSLTSCL